MSGRELVSRCAWGEADIPADVNAGIVRPDDDSGEARFPLQRQIGAFEFQLATAGASEATAFRNLERERFGSRGPTGSHWLAVDRQLECAGWRNAADHGILLVVLQGKDAAGDPSHFDAFGIAGPKTDLAPFLWSGSPDVLLVKMHDELAAAVRMDDLQTVGAAAAFVGERPFGAVAAHGGRILDQQADGSAAAI